MRELTHKLRQFVGAEAVVALDGNRGELYSGVSGGGSWLRELVGLGGRGEAVGGLGAAHTVAGADADGLPLLVAQRRLDLQRVRRVTRRRVADLSFTLPFVVHLLLHETPCR